MEYLKVVDLHIHAFDEWAAGLVRCFDLKFLKDSTIGIDALHYLETLPKEPLVSALGGSPLALESTIIDSITDLHAAGLKLHFVFNGLESGVDKDLVASSAVAAQINNESFTLYERSQAEQAKNSFHRTGISDLSSLSEVLKQILHQNNIAFTVAPYSALAQLVYYEKHPSQFIDAIYGPSELFCFGVDKIIYSFSGSPVPGHGTFNWIKRRDCLAELGDIPVYVFVDALMLAGSNLLDTFPTLHKGYTFRNVVDMISGSGGSVARLCAQYHADPSLKGIYLDKYKRAMTTVKYPVVMTAEGDIEPLDKDHAPDDVHECVGLRLPEEIYMYLSRGLIRPRVLSWLTSGQITIYHPLAGGDSRSYQNLVKVQLEPLRRQALSLLTEQIHRYFQSREIKTKLWFDPGFAGAFNMRDIPSARSSLSRWNVRNDLIADFAHESIPPGTLSFAVLALDNVDLAAKTITPKPKIGQEVDKYSQPLTQSANQQQPLKHLNEVLSNTVWRFLQLRGYVNEDHQLTEWGKVLEAALDVASTSNKEEEAVFIAVELLRFRLLKPDTMFLGYAGAPDNGSDIDKRNCMLVSRIACLGKIRHQPKGYSGPLSRHLLAYQSIISNVHGSLRDLIEMVVAAMLLEGLIDRDRDDWTNIALSLPFYQEQSCALGVLTMHYLDDLSSYDNPTSQETRDEVKMKGQGWIQNSDFRGSLEDAFRMWRAVYKGVQAAGDKVKDRQMWDEVDVWLNQRK